MAVNQQVNAQVIAACHTSLLAGIVDGKFGSYQRRYLRRSTFNALTTHANILNVVNNDVSASKWSATKKTDFARDVAKDAKKIFMLCVYAKLDMRFLRKLLAKKITDSKLPYRSGPGTPDFQRFRNAQWILETPPTFNFGVGNFLNVVPSESRMPIRFDEDTVLGQGVGGGVHPARIDIEYYTCTPTTLAVDSADPTLTAPFAIKVSSEEKHARREVEFAHFLHTSNLRDNHITNLLAGFYFQGKTYLISELADTSLQSFFVRSNAGFDTAWLRTQIIGLVNALARIHGPTNGTTAYHHDIKPDNILVFPADNHRLKFTDWGCAGFDTYSPPQPSQRNDRQGKSSYLPPEHMSDQPTSRPHDVWSLACVIVELLVWFYHGWDPNGLFDFKQDIEKDDNIGRLCWFVDAGNTLVRAQTVDTMLTQLSGRSASMALVVVVVRQMLNIRPAQRLTALEARRDLLAIAPNW